MVSIFYINHPKKSIAISAPLDSAPLMKKLTIKLPIIQIQEYPAKSTTNHAKKSDKYNTIQVINLLFIIIHDFFFLVLIKIGKFFYQ